jgi:hypothetical protein
VNGSPLVGAAGLRVQNRVKLQHKGVLWGMYVRPEARGKGLAAALVQQVVEHARTLVEEVCLTVVASNAAAIRLYGAAGFKEYGLERRALKVGSEYYDEVLMALPLKPGAEITSRDWCGLFIPGSKLTWVVVFATSETPARVQGWWRGKRLLEYGSSWSGQVSFATTQKKWLDFINSINSGEVMPCSLKSLFFFWKRS